MSVSGINRKKLENKQKFVFSETDVLPPPRSSSRSVQSRLARARGQAQGGIQASGSNFNRRRLFSDKSESPLSDPVLEEVVAKLQALGDTFLPSLQEKSSLPAASLVSALGDAPGDAPGPRYREEKAPSCLCMRPLKLVMCSLCGETFPARLRTACDQHPRAVYLQDVSACKGCRQTDLAKLIEFDLPAGMQQGIKSIARKI